MLKSIAFHSGSFSYHRRCLQRGVAVAALLCSFLSGCAALTNPTTDGIPVRRVPPEFLSLPREELMSIPFPLLRQKPVEVYRYDAGDVLGIWIEGILGEANQPPPVHYSEQGNLPPAIGFPIPVDADGKIALPFIEPIKVKGLSQPEVVKAIQKAYLEPKQIIKLETRILVSLIKARVYRVVVVREDSGGLVVGTSGAIGNTKRGSGQVLELPAYQNDVLTALTKTGGLPGLDALNEVIIERGSLKARKDWPAVMPDLRRTGQQQCLAADGMGADGQFVRIPLRLRAGDPIPFTPEEIILHDGDIVYIPARDTEVYYVGGLIPPSQYTLPRDYDIDVVEAISNAKGPLVNGGLNQNNLSGANVNIGIGQSNPSLLTVIRRPPGQRGTQIMIRVDLNVALRDPRERILVQPGDILLLQETPGEAFTRWFTETTRFNFLGTFIRQRDLTGTVNSNLP